MIIRLTVLSAPLALIAAPLPAQFVPVSQERYVFESTGKDFFIQESTDFEPFNASFTAVAQSSIISADAITGNGFGGPDPTFSINSVTSYFKVVFNVEQSTDYLFAGSLVTGVFGSGVAHFSGPDGAVVDLISSGEDTFAWNEAGVLTPGEYTLQVFISNSIGADLSTFEFSLTVPAPSAAAALIGLGLIPSRRRRTQRV